MIQTPLEAAHAYVKRGWGCVPLYGVDEAGICRCDAGAVCPEKTRGKHPHGTKRGWRTFTSGADVQAWWDDNPDDNLGIATGIESGIFVFDVDGAAGVGSVQAFVLEHGAMPVTRIVRTGSGGLHYFFRHPSHFVVYNSTSYIGAGIDIRGKGGQVVAPPSRSGRGPYEVIADVDVADAPDWLLTLLHEHSDRLEHGHKAEVKAAEHVDVELLPERVTTLRNQLVGMDEGRFRHFHALVAACYEAGFTQGETVSIVAPWCAAVGKFVGRVEQEVARTWGKLEAESQRANEWIDGLGDRVKQKVTTEQQENPWPSVTDVAATTSTPAAHQASSPSSAPTAETAATSGSTSPQIPSSPSPQDPSETPELPASWAPVDPGPILDGTYEPPVAELFPRSDGHCLLYRGLVHSFHGESESGKSLIAQGEVARVLGQGGTAAYIDFESDASSVFGRLRDMGAPQDGLRHRFTYRRPDTDPFSTPAEREAFGRLLAETLDLVIIDGVTDALSVFGASSNDMDEVTAVMRRFMRRVAQRTGAAVVMVDHVTKDADTRGRHAVGSQAKLNGLDGAAYVIEVAEVLGQGLRGAVTMRVGKDRPGGVRPHAGEWRKGDRTQLAARVVVDSTGQDIRISVEAPGAVTGAVLADGRQLRPGWLTLTMERVSTTLADAGCSLSKNGVETRTKGKASAVRQALKTLIDEQFVAVVSGVRGDEFELTRRYLQAEDELSEEYLGWAQNGTGLATSSHLVPTSSRAEGTNLVPNPSPLRGGDEVKGRGEALTSSPERDEVRAEVLVSCDGCFQPTLEAVADAFGGLCGKCAHEAGLL